MRFRAWPFLLLIVVVSTAASEAMAAKTPPRTQIRADGDAVRLDPYTSSWAFREPAGGCRAYIADGVASFDPAILVSHRHAQPRIAVMRDRKPQVGLRSFESLGRDGYVKGHGRRVRFDLDRVRRRGAVEWLIRFRVDVDERPYFLMALGWPEQGRCRTGGSAHYAFAIGRR